MAKTKSKTKAKSKRKPNKAFMAPKQPDEILGNIVGHDPLPRTEIVKKLWAFIKRVGIQDGRNILASNNAKMQAFAGRKKTITMFEMNSLISDHLCD